MSKKVTSPYTDAALAGANRLKQFEDFLKKTPVPPLGYTIEPKPPEQRDMEAIEQEVLGQ